MKTWCALVILTVLVSSLLASSSVKTPSLKVKEEPHLLLCFCSRCHTQWTTGDTYFESDGKLSFYYNSGNVEEMVARVIRNGKKPLSTRELVPTPDEMMDLRRVLPMLRRRDKRLFEYPYGDDEHD